MLSSNRTSPSPNPRQTGPTKFTQISLEHISNASLADYFPGNLCVACNKAVSPSGQHGPKRFLISGQGPSLSIQPDKETWSLPMDPNQVRVPFYCAGCEDARWCSFACTQKGARWFRPLGADHTVVLHHGSYDAHQQFCRLGASKSLEPLLDEGDPAYHRRALLFPMDQAAGELVSVHYDPQTGSLLVGDSPFKRFEALASDGSITAVPTCRVLGRHELGFMDRVMVHDLLLISYLQTGPTQFRLINQSIAALGKPQQLKTWCGPVLILAVSRNPEGRHCLVDDVSHRDVSLAISYFRSHGNNIGVPGSEFRENFYPVLKMTDTNNASITSAFGKVPSMVPIHVSPFSMMSRDWKPCIMAHRLGLSWYITTANCPSWKALNSDQNKDARWLK